jgi:hypothetical protein
VHKFMIVGIIQERVKPAPRRTYFFKTISGKQH